MQKSSTIYSSRTGPMVDNATMIAWAAIERLQINKKGDILDFEPKPRWALEKL